MLLPLLPWELVRFNGAPDRNPGKGRRLPGGYRGAALVSMEPQIGIRGRLSRSRNLRRRSQSFNGAPDRNPGKAQRVVKERDGLLSFNGAPDRNPGKGPMQPASPRASGGFNGAPDRNPGKEEALDLMIADCQNVSMEPQIGIRGRTALLGWARKGKPGFNGAPDRNPGKGG